MARAETAVLVTRPAPGAARLSDLLATKPGLKPFRAPLSVVEPLPVPALRAEDFDLLLITSPRALDAAEALKSLPLAVVGHASAAEAAARGFRVSITGPGYADDDLAGLIPSSAKILHLSGTHVSRDLAPLFAARGSSYRRVPVYEATAVQQLPNAAQDFFAFQGRRIVTFLSARAAEIFADLLKNMSDHAALTAICASERIARAATASGLFTETRSADTANLEAFVDFVSSRRT